jgi:subtilisin family serine protease
MRKKAVIFCGLAVVLGSLMLNAQRQASFPVIVVLEDNVRYSDFVRSFTPDERMRAEPDAWGYQNHGVLGAIQSLERRGGFKAERAFSAAIRGFSARLTTAQIQQLENDSLVNFIEPDGEMSIIAQQIPWGIDRVGATVSSTLAGNGSGTVTGVRAYVIDTGIDPNHNDLNVVGHVNFAGGQNKDCNGHGTHVSGTIGAEDNTSDVVGVAPGIALVGVKVLGCGGSGTTSGVIAGVDWVTANAVKPAVANMSLGGGASTSLDNAVRNSAASGVFYALAAGNSGADACNSSPARAGAGTNNGILTVAATDISNVEASWSNYGSCVDIHGPGVSILSTRRGGGTTTLSGTSMASPHGAGSGALYLSTHTSATASAVESALKGAASTPGTTSKSGAAIKLLNVSTF